MSRYFNLRLYYFFLMLKYIIYVFWIDFKVFFICLLKYLILVYKYYLFFRNEDKEKLKGFGKGKLILNCLN